VKKNGLSIPYIGRVWITFCQLFDTAAAEFFLPSIQTNVVAWRFGPSRARKEVLSL
jgi:hypothetical protein